MKCTATLIVILFMCTVILVKANTVSGTENMSAKGTTSVTATVEISTQNSESDTVKTGDNSQWQEYLLLCLMSGIVILANLVRLYREEFE